jgi:hypothetical protein
MADSSAVSGKVQDDLGIFCCAQRIIGTSQKDTRACLTRSPLAKPGGGGWGLEHQNK